MSPYVIPAKVGIYHRFRTFLWIPAFTGMTTWCLGAAPTKPVERKTLIIAVGDSTTAGTPFARSPLEDPPNGSGDATRQASDRSVSDPEGLFSYWMMRRRPGWEVLNYGMAGQTSSQIRAR